MSEYTSEHPSPRFQQLGELYRQVHESGIEGGASAENVFAGGSLLAHVAVVSELAKHCQANTVLDYGCGKAKLYDEKNLTLPDGRSISSVQEFWNVSNVCRYDPGVEAYAQLPSEPCDGVVSTDVLEHIPEEDIDWVLAECFGLAKSFVYMNIASYPAKKTLPNGWNAHVTIKPPGWWREKIEKAAQGWSGRAYVFEVSEKRKGISRAIMGLLSGGKMKLTRIEMWK